MNKYNVTLIGKVAFNRKFAIVANNEKEAAKLGKEMLRYHLQSLIDCDVEEIHIEAFKKKKT